MSMSCAALLGPLTWIGALPSAPFRVRGLNPCTCPPSRLVRREPTTGGRAAARCFPEAATQPTAFITRAPLRREWEWSPSKLLGRKTTVRARLLCKWLPLEGACPGLALTHAGRPPLDDDGGNTSRCRWAALPLRGTLMTTGVMDVSWVAAGGPSVAPALLPPPTSMHPRASIRPSPLIIRSMITMTISSGLLVVVPPRSSSAASGVVDDGADVVACPRNSS